jgi:uncharacterized protein with PIN domain
MACRFRNQARIREVSFVIELDSKTFQSRANPCPHCGRILSNATCKHQRIQAPEDSQERAEPFLRLVAEQSYGLGCSDVLLFALQ